MSSFFPRSDLRILANKYSGSAPRYTSYPTAVEFHSDVDALRWEELLLQENDNTFGVYAHIPFCQTLCYFCACNKIITQNRAGVRPFLDAIKKEFALQAQYLTRNGSRDKQMGQIHWGGGTPNYLLPEDMRELHTSMETYLGKPMKGAECSVEIDPRGITTEQLATLIDLGMNRISFGVQDLSPEVQEAINRIQPLSLTTHVIKEARKLGFKSINIDLIYGLPLQTVETFSETVKSIITLRPERVALYGYAHVTWIQKVQRSFDKLPLPTPEERIEIFLEAVEAFTQAGYEHIGLDHFALPDDTLVQARENGKLNRNFMGYSIHRGSQIAAFGPSAISSVEKGFAQNSKELPEYIQSIESHKLAITRGVERSPEDILRSHVIEDVLCHGKIFYKDFTHRWGADFYQVFPDAFAALESFAEDGIVQIQNDGFSITPIGRFFARNVATIFEAYLQKHKEKERPVFSQAV
jgi:oxygen-independent coproporphyrinogen III oxidase